MKLDWSNKMKLSELLGGDKFSYDGKIFTKGSIVFNYYYTCVCVNNSEYIRLLRPDTEVSVLVPINTLKRGDSCIFGNKIYTVTDHVSFNFYYIISEDYHIEVLSANELVQKL
jgi:hypothetical protein